MTEEMLIPYEKNTYQSELKEGLDKGRPLFIHMPGNTICTFNLKVALTVATRNQLSEEHFPVLFVISCKNFTSPEGIRMTNESYTCYPCEEEILLRESCPMYVLAVERNVLIENEFSGFAPFNGRQLTIIHLFHNGE